MSTGYYPPNLDQVNAIVHFGHWLQINFEEYAALTLRQIATHDSFPSAVQGNSTALDYFHDAFGTNTTISHGQEVIASLLQEDNCNKATLLNGFLDIVSVGLVILRLISKRMSRSKLGWDDHLCWLALVFFLMKQPVILYECKVLKAGYHAWDIPLQPYLKILQIIFWLEIPYYPNLCLIKLSILVFYGSIFRAYRRAVMASWILGVILLLGNVTAIVGIFQYKPFDYWNHVLDHRPAYDRLAFFSSIGYITIITDFAMLALPACILPKMKAMHIRDKILLLCLFACGTFAGIAGILRLISLPTWVYSADWSAAATNTATWSNMEIHFAIICACVPHLRPVASWTATKVRAGFGKLRSSASSRKGSDTSGVVVDIHDNEAFHKDSGRKGGVVAKCGLTFDEKDMGGIVDPSKQNYNVAVAAIAEKKKPKKKGMFSALMGSLDITQGSMTDVDLEKADLSPTSTKEGSNLELSRATTQSAAGNSRSGSLHDGEIISPQDKDLEKGGA